MRFEVENLFEPGKRPSLELSSLHRGPQDRKAAPHTDPGYFPRDADDFYQGLGEEPWDGAIDPDDGVVFLDDDESDSLEDSYDTLERAHCPSEFPRVVTKADQKLWKKTESAERRRLKRRQANNGLPDSYDPSEMQKPATASTIEAIVAMNDSERSHDES